MRFNMRAFNNYTEEVDEPNDARMNFRTKARIKKAIQRAATLSGVDDSTFTMSAAYQSALATIAAHEKTLLSPLDHEVFFNALDNAVEPCEKLKQAFARHSDTVISK